MTSEDMKKVMNELREIKCSMEFMNKKFEDVLKELKEVKVENEKYKKDVDMLKEKVVYLEEEVCELKNEQLRDNLEISGLPHKDGENCNLIAFNVCRQVYPDIKQEDIVDAFRMGSAKDKEGRPRMQRNMLVKLKEKKVRNLIYKNKKRLKGVDTAKLGLSAEKKRLYINENLSRESKFLFSKANALRKEKSWRYIWTDFGAILLRKADDSKVLRVRSEKDLVFIK